jgi:hypothetical protein
LLGRIIGIGVAAWGALMLVTTTLTIAAPQDYRFEAVVPGLRFRMVQFTLAI